MYFMLIYFKLKRNIYTICWVFFLLFISSCQNDANYQPDKYVAYQSVSEIVDVITFGIKEHNADTVWSIMQNDQLLIDALKSSNSESARQILLRLEGPDGIKIQQKNKLEKLSKLQTFMTNVIGERITIDPTEFKCTGFDYMKRTPYADGTDAEEQTYKIVYSNGPNESYSFVIHVMKWHGKFHLINTENWLESIS